MTKLLGAVSAPVGTETSTATLRRVRQGFELGVFAADRFLLHTYDTLEAAVRGLVETLGWHMYRGIVLERRELCLWLVGDDAEELARAAEDKGYARVSTVMVWDGQRAELTSAGRTLDRTLLVRCRRRSALGGHAVLARASAEDSTEWLAQAAMDFLPQQSELAAVCRRVQPMQLQYGDAAAAGVELDAAAAALVPA